jgi:hypothetical protein
MELGAVRLISFVGPRGPYRISLPDCSSSLEDQSIFVIENGETSRWTVEVDETASGIRKLAGMTHEPSGLWFELYLGSPPEVNYWGDRTLVRTDKAVD